MQGTPKSIGHFTPTVSDSIVEEDTTPEEDFRDTINRLINDEEGFGEDYIQPTASTLIEKSTDTNVLPQKIHDFLNCRMTSKNKLRLVLM